MGWGAETNLNANVLTVHVLCCPIKSLNLFFFFFFSKFATTAHRVLSRKCQTREAKSDRMSY